MFVTDPLIVRFVPDNILPLWFRRFPLINIELFATIDELVEVRMSVACCSAFNWLRESATACQPLGASGTPSFIMTPF